MSYKTVLVHIDESRHIDSRVEFAARVARKQSAHLIGVAVTGRTSPRCNEPGITGNNPQVAASQQASIDALEQFEAMARQAGVASFEKQLIDEDVEGGISLQTRYCDLIVLSQRDPNEQSPAASVGFPACIIHNAACPALIVPCKELPAGTGDNILIGWNGSMEATRAIHSAIPLIRQAAKVDIAVFDPGIHDKPSGGKAGVELAQFLARHGVQADIIRQSSRGEPGDALLSLAANRGSDMLVAGFFGRWRFGEILLGGVTSAVLESSTLPVLMSH